MANIKFRSWPHRRELRRCVIIASSLAALGIGSTRPAEAWPGATAWATYLRAGPGFGYAVIDEIGNRGEVDVQACDGGWCRVVYGQAAGYVEADLLAPRMGPTPAKPAAAGVADCFLSRQAGYPRSEETRFCPRG